MGKLQKIEKLILKGKEPELIKLSGDKDKAVRLAAIQGLGKVGKDDSFNALIAEMQDEDSDIRAMCVESLGLLKNSRADTHLRYLLQHEKNGDVIFAAKKALAQLHKESQ